MRFFPLLLLLAVTACAEASVAPGPPPVAPPPALAVGSWTLTHVEGEPLPAYTAHRAVNGVLEQVWVDSARLDIGREGAWLQVIWTHSVIGGVRVDHLPIVERGSARIEEGHHRFTSESGQRTKRVDNRLADRLEVLETALAPWLEAGMNVTRYIPREPPSEGVPTPQTEVWRAVATAAGALPARAYLFRDEPLPGSATEFRVDSAQLVLQPTGTYVRRTWSSEWSTTDFAGGQPFTRVQRYLDYDRGNWSRADGAILLQSEWIQNQRVPGIAASDDVMHLSQGLTWGDPPFVLTFTLVR